VKLKSIFRDQGQKIANDLRKTLIFLLKICVIAITKLSFIEVVEAGKGLSFLMLILY